MQISQWRPEVKRFERTTAGSPGDNRVPLSDILLAVLFRVSNGIDEPSDICEIAFHSRYEESIHLSQHVKRKGF